MKMKKFKNIKEFLKTCSDDEQEYIYDLYNNASVADLIELLFEHLPAKNTIKEIKRYREEMKESAIVILLEVMDVEYDIFKRNFK